MELQERIRICAHFAEVVKENKHSFLLYGCTALSHNYVECLISEQERLEAVE